MPKCPKCGEMNDEEMVCCVNCDAILIKGTEITGSGKVILGTIKVGGKK